MQTEISTIEAFYKCPICLRQQKTNLCIAETKNPMVRARWCSNSMCEARHNIEYFMRKKRTGKIDFKVVKFTTNEQVSNQRVSLLYPN